MNEEIAIGFSEKPVPLFLSLQALKMSLMIKIITHAFRLIAATEPLADRHYKVLCPHHDRNGRESL